MVRDISHDVPWLASAQSADRVYRGCRDGPARPDLDDRAVADLLLTLQPGRGPSTRCELAEYVVIDDHAFTSENMIAFHAPACQDYN